MTIAHHLGFPRIGANRQLKWALERYWQGQITQAELYEQGMQIRTENYTQQIKAGLDFLSVGDFSWYDHVLDMSFLLGVIPERFQSPSPDIDTYFRMARGRAPQGEDTFASEMTKWFDTNYHYIVPELSEQQLFTMTHHKLFDEIKEAKSFNKKIKPCIIGPVTYLYLSKVKNPNFNKLSLLKKLQETYLEILTKCREEGIEWVQIEEPILVLELDPAWQKAIKETYDFLQVKDLKLLLTTYFGSLGQNIKLASTLPTAGLHIDAIRGQDQLSEIINLIPQNKILSVGIVDGRNIWRTDLRKALAILKPLHAKIGERLWIGSSCSLLHSPVDLNNETVLEADIKNWLAFAVQKLHEIATLAKAFNEEEASIATELTASDAIVVAKSESTRIHHPLVKKRLKDITSDMTQRKNPYSLRKIIQNSALNLPIFPTTTIGSFPQTQAIRSLRKDLKSGKIDEENYEYEIKKQIAYAIQQQLELDLDVLVHGEAERNDMVEYFGEQLAGFAFTQNGWVQSYGSRCVKPPIIYGDVFREKPMTVKWITYAQTLTTKLVKGMLTGPMTILCWSFVRDDQPREVTAKQIALALRDEVIDLAKNGIKVIQIDEPAFREGLPLKKIYWQDYLQEAVLAFRLTSSGIPDHVQIHTHMCYSEFNDIIEAIANLDADVITIETSRSQMELLKAFETFHYPNDIGPGVYDIHSPCIPTVDEIVALIEKATQFIPITQLWINPDCGLKTREWRETRLALQNMVNAAKMLREKQGVIATEKVR